jgi:transcriptional regulator with XRE-family HTH domain
MSEIANEGPEPGQRVELRAMLAPPGQAPESRMAERIRVARNHLGLTIEAMSRLCKEYDPDGNGVSPPSISRYEAGDSLPGAREIRILCDALEVPPLWLLYGRLEHSGTTESDTELLRVLDRWVRQRKDDANIGGTTVDAMLKFHAERERKERLAKAKKPGAT